jgi:hypothetical protein
MVVLAGNDNVNGPGCVRDTTTKRAVIKAGYVGTPFLQFRDRAQTQPHRESAFRVVEPLSTTQATATFDQVAVK